MEWLTEDNMDDLDCADAILEQARNAVDHKQGAAAAKLAAAHIQLWWAKEARAYHAAAQAHRQAMQTPPLSPFPAPPYGGGF